MTKETFLNILGWLAFALGAAVVTGGMGCVVAVVTYVPAAVRQHLHFAGHPDWLVTIAHWTMIGLCLVWALALCRLMVWAVSKLKAAHERARRVVAFHGLIQTPDTKSDPYRDENRRTLELRIKPDLT